MNDDKKIQLTELRNLLDKNFLKIHYFKSNFKNEAYYRRASNLSNERRKLQEEINSLLKSK